MELTELKRILNTGELPEYNDGKLSKFLEKHGGSIMSGVTGTIGMIGLIGAASSYNKTANDLLQDAGKSEQNIGGVGYTVQNAVNQGRESAEVSVLTTASTLGLMGTGASTGAAVGSLLGPIGGAVGGAIGAVGGLVGGLISGGAKRREMNRLMKLAELKRINQNDFNRSGALTTVLQNNLAETEGDQTQQTLYAAANGKESYSAGGPTSGYNAMVSNGEIIANKFTGEMFRVPGIPNNKDGKLAFIRPSDTIISNKYGLSDYVAETGDLEGGEAMQSVIMKAKGKRGYKDGKLPGFKWGLPEWANLGVNALGAITSAADASSIANEALSQPNFRVKLLNAPRVNDIMLGRRENMYSILPDYYNSIAKQRYNNRNTYGLSQAQRAMLDQNAEEKARESMGRLNLEMQRGNNEMLRQAAAMMAQQDATQAQLDQHAITSEYDAYNQAHGARRLMSSQRKADAMNYLNNLAKGLTDMHMWRQQMDLYQQDIDERRKDRESKYRKPEEKVSTDSLNFSATPLGKRFSKYYGPLNSNKLGLTYAPSLLGVGLGYGLGLTWSLPEQIVPILNGRKVKSPSKSNISTVVNPYGDPRYNMLNVNTIGYDPAAFRYYKGDPNKKGI